jgi:MtfA peptidase
MQRFSKRVLLVHAATSGVVGAAVCGFLLVREAPAWSFGLVTAMFAAWLVFGMRRYIRRWRLGSEPPATIRAALEEHVRFYQRITPTQQARFRREVHWFLAEQNIVGVRTELTQEVLALVAASAVVLTFGRPHHEWSDTRDILIYPTAFASGSYEMGGKNAHVAGQVGAQGPIIFAEDQLRAGFRQSKDGHNVGLHEFAHVLDFGDGYFDGLPANVHWESMRPWVDEMTSELRRKDGPRSRRLLRDYGYTNEAEFFACATELYFERPDAIRRKSPDLYEVLSQYYGDELLPR